MALSRKQCTKCKKWRKRELFHASRKGRSGLHSSCCYCRREAKRLLDLRKKREGRLQEIKPEWELTLNDW